MNRIALTPIALVLALTACEVQTVDNRMDDPNAARGSVTGTVSSTTNTSSVTAFEVQADGSLTAVSEPGDVQADGSYTLSVLADSDDGQLLIADSSGELTQAVLVSFDVQDGSEDSAPQMNAESTSESRVFVDLVQDGRATNDGLLTGFVQAMIDASVASEAEADADEQGSIDAMADAMASALISFNLTEIELESMNQAQAEADAEGRDEGGIEEALEEVGLTLDDLFLTAHVTAEATGAVAANAGDDADGGANAMASIFTEMRARVATEVIGDVTSGLDLSTSSQDDVEEANEGLLSGLFGSSTDVIAGVDLDVTAAFDDWAADVGVILNAELSAEGRSAVNDADEAAAEAEAELQVTLDAIVDSGEEAEAQAEAVVAAMTTYEATIEGDVRVQALFDSELGEDGARAMIDVLIQVHASLDGDAMTNN